MLQNFIAGAQQWGTQKNGRTDKGVYDAWTSAGKKKPDMLELN